MNLAFDEKRIKYIVYQLPNGKVVNFKFLNNNLADIDVLYENELNLSYTKEDVEKENDLKTLEVSRKKEWKNFGISGHPAVKDAEVINGADKNEIERFDYTQKTYLSNNTKDEKESTNDLKNRG